MPRAMYFKAPVGAGRPEEGRVTVRVARALLLLEDFGRAAAVVRLDRARRIVGRRFSWSILMLVVRNFSNG
jgi:hypothetical protein